MRSKCWEKGGAELWSKNLIDPKAVAKGIVQLVAAACQEAQLGRSKGVRYVSTLNEGCYRRLIDGVMEVLLSLIECRGDDDFVGFEREVRALVDREVWDLRLVVPVYG